MIKHKLTKEIEKHLKGIAETLPNVFYTVQATGFWKGADLKGSAVEKDTDGKPLEDEKMYAVAEPMHIASNHKRRLRKAYESEGSEGVKKYVSKVNALVQKAIEQNKN